MVNVPPPDSASIVPLLISGNVALPTTPCVPAIVIWGPIVNAPLVGRRVFVQPGAPVCENNTSPDPPSVWLPLKLTNVPAYDPVLVIVSVLLSVSPSSTVSTASLLTVVAALSVMPSSVPPVTVSVAPFPAVTLPFLIVPPLVRFQLPKEGSSVNVAPVLSSVPAISTQAPPAWNPDAFKFNPSLVNEPAKTSISPLAASIVPLFVRLEP